MLINSVLQLFKNCAVQSWNMLSSSIRKVSCTSLLHKYEALQKHESGEAKKDVADHYNVPQNTLSTWIKNKEKIFKAFEGGDNHKQQKLRTSVHTSLDKALYRRNLYT